MNQRKTLLGVAALVATIAVACSGDSGTTATTQTPPLGGQATTAIPSATPSPTPIPIDAPDNADDAAASGLLAEIGPDQLAVAGALTQMGWTTDLTRFAADLDVRNLSSGGVPRDGIASIDAPNFAPVSDPPNYMRPDEPVIILNLNGDVRGYPLSIMTQHEIVNDVVGGEPVTVTFCPLCNTSLVFPRTLPDGTVLEFGVSGFLQNSDLIMYDRQTESLWQQITGTGLIGTHAGTQLEFLPVTIAGWAEFESSFPEGQIMLRPVNGEVHSVTGQSLSRDYDRPPYAGYDSIDSSPFLYRGTFDGRLLPMERVASVTLNDFDVAYPYSFLSEKPVINDVVEGTPLVVFFDNGTESAFTARTGNFSKSGSTTLFQRTVDDQVLIFELVDGVITDTDTGSTWSKFGIALDGELAGTQLEPVTHAAHFWFAWAAFRPDTEVRGTTELLTSTLTEVTSPG